MEDPTDIFELIDTLVSLGMLALEIIKFIISCKNTKKPPSVDSRDDG